MADAVWWAVALAFLLWWAPAILLALARRPLGRLRFRLAMGLGTVLREVGAVELARGVYAAELARARRRVRALKGRWRW